MSINNSTFESYYNLAKEQIIENHPKKALIYIQIHLKLHPLDAYAYLLKGNIYSILKQYENSIVQYDKCNKINSNISECYNSLAYSYSKLNKYQTAIKLVSTAIELNPKFLDAYYNKGIFLMKLKTKYSFNEALKTFTKLYSLDRNMHEALLQRGICLVRLERLEEALIELNTYIELVPNNMQAFFELGYILSSLGKYKEAIEANNKVLNLSPGFINANYNKALCYIELKDFDNAIKEFNIVIKANSKDVNSFFKRGECYIEQKHFTHALHDFEKVIKYDNFNASAHYNKGICLSNFKNYKEAKKAFQIAVNLNPKNELYYHTLGNCLRKLKKHKEAIQMYEKGKELKRLNDITNEEKEKDSKDNFSVISIRNNDGFLRRVKTVKETNKDNNDNSNNIINESGLVSHIKEVLKGESVNKLVNKLDFTKAVNMKHKLEKFNKK